MDCQFTVINDKFNLFNLINVIHNRDDRKAFERIIGCLLEFFFKKKSQFGDIHKYCVWGIKISEIDKVKSLPIIKVWTGR